MSFSARYVPVVLLTLLSLSVALSAQTTTTQAAKAPGGSVSGRVTIKDKGAAGVAVSLRKSEVTNPFEQYSRATTDHDGYYRITNVPAGSYEVTPSAPAFVLVDVQRAKSVVVAEGETVEGINFSLIRGGVITGKVTDADGRPVIQQMVNLFMADAFNVQQQQGPQRPAFPSNSASTDDRGIYRMYGLRAGRYKVATGRSDETFNPGVYQTRANYRQVFHPNVNEHAKATIIEVSEGSEANDVDIKLGAALQTFSVSGRIVRSDTGLPVPNIQFALQRFAGQRSEFINPPLVSNAQGDFFTEGLVAGKYQMFLFQEMNNDLRSEPHSFEIIDQDVSNVTIKVWNGGSMTGVVVIESENKTAVQRLQQLRLMAFRTASPEGASTFGQSSSSLIGADGSFRIAGLPGGTINVQLAPGMALSDIKGFMISRIERDGVILPKGIEVKEGEQISGVRVVLAYGNGSIRGVVKVENGALPANAQVYVRLSKPGENFSGIRPTPVDARGNFLMDGIPTGTYELVLQFFGGMPQPRPIKREVSVQDGVVTDLMITVDLAQQPKP